MTINKKLLNVFLAALLLATSCSSDSGSDNVRNMVIPDGQSDMACPPAKGEKWEGPVEKDGTPICPEESKTPLGRLLPIGISEELVLPDADPHATQCHPSPCERGSVDYASSTAPDIVVVAFGDSFASGEGAPFESHSAGGDGDLSPSDPLWPADADNYNGPVYCHRSPRSTFARAMVDASNALPGVRLAWRSFACSGAVVDNLISVRQDLSGVTGFPGSEVASERYNQPQFTQVTAWVNTVSPERSASVAYLNIGGNDAHFSDAITLCVESADCEEDDDDEAAILEGYGDDASNLVPRKLRQVEAAFSSSTWSPEEVLYTVVPNIAFAEGQACGEDHDPGNRMQSFPEDYLSSAEVNFLWDTIGVPLQESMKSQGRDNGWHVVEADDFSSHGICARVPWVNNNESAINSQGADSRTWPDISMGVWHPNDAGYDNWAKELKNPLTHAIADELPADTTITNFVLDGSTVTFDYAIEPRNDGGLPSYIDRSTNVLRVSGRCAEGGFRLDYVYVFSPDDDRQTGETISIQPCLDREIANIKLKQFNCFLDVNDFCGNAAVVEAEQDIAPQIQADQVPDDFLPGLEDGQPGNWFAPDEDDIGDPIKGG